MGRVVLQVVLPAISAGLKLLFLQVAAKMSFPQGTSPGLLDRQGSIACPMVAFIVLLIQTHHLCTRLCDE